jgi:hypothetical protein
MCGRVSGRAITTEDPTRVVWLNHRHVPRERISMFRLVAPRVSGRAVTMEDRTRVVWLNHRQVPRERISMFRLLTIPVDIYLESADDAGIASFHFLL